MSRRALLPSTRREIVRGRPEPVKGAPSSRPFGQTLDRTTAASPPDPTAPIGLRGGADKLTADLRTLRMDSISMPKVYRAPAAISAVGWVTFALAVVLGLSMVTVGSGQPGAVGNVVIGTLVLLLSAWFGSIIATNRLIVTEDGLVHWYNLRWRRIGWAEIQSFSVGPGRTAMRWPCLVIRLDNGWVTVTSVSSFTRRYPARVADELSVLQQAFGSDPPTDLRQPS